MNIKKIVGVPLGIAGMGIGLGLIGSNLESTSPEIAANISEAGTTATKFIAPSISIMAGGYLINQIKQIRNINSKNNKVNFYYKL